MKLNKLANSISSKMTDSQSNVRLQRKIKELEEQLESNSEGEFLREINKIRPSRQVRQTFLDQEIKERAKSLLEEGQASAIILLPIEENSKHQAEIEDGELTWRAANFLIEQGHSEWQQLMCCWSKLNSSEDSHTKSLIHHRHRVELNALDNAEALMIEIAKVISWKEEEIEDKNLILKPILGSIATKYQRKPEFANLYDSLLILTREKSLASLNEYPDLHERQKIVILQLARFTVRNPQTFYKNNLPLIFLNEQLKVAIRHSTTPLLAKHALALSRIKDKQTQQDLIEQAQANEWSLKKLREAISKIQPSQTKQQKVNTFKQQKSVVQTLNQTLNKPSIQKLTSKQVEQLANSLRKKLELLEEVLNSESSKTPS